MSLESLAPISAACAVTAAIMYPVDVLRALKMASATGGGISIGEFIKHHGLKGVMSQGLVPEITRATWMRILKFFFFPFTFSLIYGKKPSEGKPWEKALAGALAVIPEVATITTLELAKIGLQLDSKNVYKNSTMLLVRDVKQRYGSLGLMAGWQGVQLRQSIWTGTYFATLDSFKKLSKKGLDSISYTANNPALVNFSAGFLAGVVGAFANTPFDVIRTGIQKEFLNLPPSTTPVNTMSYAFGFPKYFSLMKDVISKRGITALYSGFGMKALHMGGSGACVAWLIPVFADIFGVDPQKLM